MSKSDILNTDIAKDFRKGLLKFFILKMLAREPMHGYAMMARIQEICSWKASPGSMYPTLLNLSTQGLIRMKVVEMKKMYTITPKGKAYIDGVTAGIEDGLNEISRIFKEL